MRRSMDPSRTSTALDGSEAGRSYQNHVNAESSQPSATTIKGRKHACVNCRQRKKRCDLKHPRCSLCIRHQEYCIYPAAKIVQSISGRGVATVQHESGDVEYIPSNVEYIPSSVFQHSSPSVGTNWSGNSVANTPMTDPWDSHQILPQWSPGGNLLPAGTSPPSLASWTQRLPTPHSQPYSVTQDDLNFNVGSSNHFSSPAVVSTRSTSSREDSRSRADSQASETLSSLENLPHMIETFFSKHHHLLPCIHQSSFMEQIKSDRKYVDQSPLVWSLVAMVCLTHQSEDYRAMGHRRFSRARTLLKASLEEYQNNTETLQASVWVVLMIYMQGDHITAWLFLSKSWALATVSGSSQIDRRGGFRAKAASNSKIKTEEKRKAIWALYILDRAISCLIPIPPTINDRDFYVNIPMDDDKFQKSSSLNVDELQHQSTPFTDDLSTLIGPYLLQGPESGPTIGHIYRASVLIGRIVSLHNRPHVSRTSKEYLNELSHIERVLGIFEFSLSRSSIRHKELPESTNTYVLWLRTLIQMCNILLFHPQVDTEPVSTQGTMTLSNGKSALERCKMSADSILHDLRSCEELCSAALHNPFLLNSIYLCSRLLIISKVEEDGKYRDDIQFLVDMVKQISESGYILAQRFGYEIRKDLRRKPEEFLKLKTGSGWYLSCEIPEME